MPGQVGLGCRQSCLGQGRQDNAVVGKGCRFLLRLRRVHKKAIAVQNGFVFENFHIVLLSVCRVGLGCRGSCGGLCILVWVLINHNTYFGSFGSSAVGDTVECNIANSECIARHLRLYSKSQKTIGIDDGRCK